MTGVIFIQRCRALCVISAAHYILAAQAVSGPGSEMQDAERLLSAGPESPEDSPAQQTKKTEVMRRAEKEAPVTQKLESSGTTDFEVKMPRTFATALSDLWIPYVWQIHDGIHHSAFRPETQFSNVQCKKVNVSNVALISRGFFAESTAVVFDIEGSCKGEYCWQNFGYTAQGSFNSKHRGPFEMEIPPELPGPRDEGPLGKAKLGLEDAGWCAPVSGFQSKVDWAPAGCEGLSCDVMDEAEKLMTGKNKGSEVFQGALCAALRKKAEPQFHVNPEPPFGAHVPFGTIVFLVVSVVSSVFLAVGTYRQNVRAFDAWRDAFLLGEQAHAKAIAGAKVPPPQGAIAKK